MSDSKIQQVWNYSYADFSEHHRQSREQFKTSHAIQNCKTGILGATISQCSDCGHIEYHNNSCRNRNCPNCQAVKKELWVEKSVNQKVSFLSRCLCYGINLRENSCTI